jgi:hypothetical protein
MEYVSHEAVRAPALVLENIGYDVWLGTTEATGSHSPTSIETHPKIKLLRLLQTRHS